MLGRHGHVRLYEVAGRAIVKSNVDVKTATQYVPGCSMIF